MRAILPVILVYAITGLIVLQAHVSSASTIYHVNIISDRVPPGGWVTIDAYVSGPDACRIILDYNYTLDYPVYPFYDNQTGYYRIIDMVQIPPDIGAGYHDLTLDCINDSYTYTIQVALPEVSAYPRYVNVGDTLRITVTNVYDMVQTFVLTIDDIPILVFQPSIYNSSFVETIKVPPLTKGWHEVRLYVTVDIFQDMFMAVKTGSTVTWYMEARGFFPERYVLVAFDRFYVEDGVVLGGTYLANVTEEINMIRERLYALEGEYNNTLSHIFELNSTLQDLNSAIAELAEKTDYLEGKFGEMKRALGELNVKINRSIEEAIKSMRENITRLEKENAELRAKLEDQEAMIERLQASISSSSRSYYVAIGVGAAGVFTGILGIVAGILLSRR